MSDSGKDIQSILRELTALGPEKLDELAIRNCFRAYSDTLKTGGEEGVRAYESIKVHLGDNHPAVYHFFKMLPQADQDAIIFNGLVKGVQDEVAEQEKKKGWMQRFFH